MKNNKKENPYYATLSIAEFPKDDKSRETMDRWLRGVADDIENSKPEEYNDTARFRLLKL